MRLPTLIFGSDFAPDKTAWIHVSEHGDVGLSFCSLSKEANISVPATTPMAAMKLFHIEYAVLVRRSVLFPVAAKAVPIEFRYLPAIDSTSFGLSEKLMSVCVLSIRGSTVVF